jgi:hypothetical protein
MKAWWIAAAALAACHGTGGPVDGDADSHCDGVEPAVVDFGACTLRHGDEEDEYGEPMFGTEGDDDECKYHLVFVPGEVRRNEPVDFHLTLTHLADGSPATGAAPNLEAFLDETHPAPEGGTAKELGDGKYTISGAEFDAKGQWTVRVHVFEGCADGETSPHGHAAFWLDVP